MALKRFALTFKGRLVIVRTDNKGHKLMKYKDLLSYTKKKSNFSVKEVRPNIFLLVFDSNKDMCLSLLRFQEFYESKTFKGKNFTLKEFYEDYSEKKGSFSYHKDWLGFNFPSTVFSSIKKMKDLTNKEKQIISLFENKKCYIIAVSKNCELNVLQHEICHALYFLNKDYRKNVKKIIGNRDAKKIHKMLIDLGYHRSVFADEVHAYLCVNYSFLKYTKRVIFGDSFKKISSKLKTNLRNFS